MIRINLLGEPEKGPTNGLLWLASYCGAILLIGGGVFFYSGSVQSDLDAKRAEVETQQKQLAELQTKTAEVAGLEEKQSQLNAKIALVAKLKKSRVGPVRVLDDLNESIPELAWLSQVVERDEKMKLQGFSLDNQTVSRFVKTLKKSPYFTGVAIVQTSQAKRDKVKISAFTLSADISYAGQILSDAEPGTEG